MMHRYGGGNETMGWSRLGGIYVPGHHVITGSSCECRLQPPSNFFWKIAFVIGVTGCTNWWILSIFNGVYHCASSEEFYDS